MAPLCGHVRIMCRHGGWTYVGREFAKSEQAELAYLLVENTWRRPVLCNVSKPPSVRRRSTISDVEEGVHLTYRHLTAIPACYVKHNNLTAQRSLIIVTSPSRKHAKGM
jgi:hypothetical protein